jgi:hypothetical protein
MTEPNELTNKIFGNLTVLRRVDNDKHGKTRWECLCSCGNKKIIGARELLKGDTKSCGCLRYLLQISQLAVHHREKEIIGQKINDLFVIEKDFISYKSGRSKYLCKCICGKEKLIAKNKLLKFEAKSCGCLVNRKKMTTLSSRQVFSKHPKTSLFVKITLKY